ncbi:acetylornithine deacetylase [Cycloclasticus pugetii]|uniref:acetylornithine deacetylase n=1 Tax=Cycloclasticus pugetii TaxID=34068 RepID=UPI00037AF7CC|nr:acetylornithine deacetylase [Cycloclasticus pugetii]
MLDMMRALIGTPSVSSTNQSLDQSNLPVIHLLADWLENLGFTVSVEPLSNHPGKANLIATIGPSHKGADGLVLSGHTDTVPYDEHHWQQDPFKLTEKNNHFYGLGSTDMKSFFALAIDVASRFNPKDFKRPLTILATADEESAMTGAQALTKKQFHHAKYAIIGEPTGLTPIRMHKGVMMESLVVTGQAGHSSNPNLGASATEGMHKVINELLKWRDDLQRKHQNPSFAITSPTMNIGSIHGGDNPNRICSHCETQIDIRPLPGMDIDTLRADLQKRLNNILSIDSKLTLAHRPIFAGVPAFETAANAKLTQMVESLTGKKAEAVAFGTEAPFLNRLGLETLVVGPGNIDQAHQANEYIPADQITPYCNFMQKIISNICIK